LPVVGTDQAGGARLGEVMQSRIAGGLIGAGREMRCAGAAGLNGGTRGEHWRTTTVRLDLMKQLAETGQS